eukprot:TRINITY_DN54290_c0_g1_i1.p1 TRINITY_DN54290_c0_g1~~TRINITY_DN54290_c0_g1_i1.p1  ORF type:complete len:341 (+),score=55.16 TRINITY_DN54290_c0_g1_i1:73-1095(+)
MGEIEPVLFGAYGSPQRSLHYIEDARSLFEPHLPCDEAQLRKVYLRLALMYHPDKHSGADRELATALFQAIGAAYEELLRPFGGKAVKRVKSAVAAAAELGDVKELERLLRELPSRAQEPDDVGVFPLMFAAKGGSIDAAALLVSYQADVNAETPFGWSVLLYAGLANRGPMVRWLVSCGARVTSHELVLVAFGGFFQSLEALVDLFQQGRIQDVRTEGGQHSLLHLVCIGIRNLERDDPDRYLRCAELVLQRGVAVDDEDARGRTCLQHYVGHPQWVHGRLENSAAHVELVRRLCAAKANPKLTNRQGHSALSLAKSQGLATVTAILQSYAVEHPRNKL